MSSSRAYKGLLIEEPQSNPHCTFLNKFQVYLYSYYYLLQKNDSNPQTAKANIGG